MKHSTAKHLLASTTALLIAASGTVPAAAQVPAYQIARQPLGAALKHFARGNGVQILFSEADVAGKMTRGVYGRFTQAEALRRLIAESGLIVTQAGPDVFVVRNAVSRVTTRTVAQRSISFVAAQQTRPATPDTDPPVATDANDPSQPAAADAIPQEESFGEDIVVTASIRRSLERAADIKRDAVQVVDSVIAEDIGKLPDPTTAAALQRIPGVQISTNRNNEAANVVIRGLGDILTTVDGREIFSTTARNFNLQDLPAPALARIDVVKSQTADIIEGGIAGVVDLRLNKPFAFREPALVLFARGNYSARADSVDPQLSALATTKFGTGIGEIGVLGNVVWTRSFSDRANTNIQDRRSSQSTPFNTPGLLIPNIIQNINEVGTTERLSANASVEWQVTPELVAFVDGLYLRTDSDVSFVGFNLQPFSPNTRITNVQASENCINALVGTNGQNATNPAFANPVRQTQRLCEPISATFQNIVVNQTTQAFDIETDTKLAAAGLRYSSGPATILVEGSYQRSRNDTANVIANVGQRIPEYTVEFDVGDAPRYTLPSDSAIRRDRLSLRVLNENFNKSRGELLTGRFDVGYSLDSILDKLQFGFRYARRDAQFDAVITNIAPPGGNVGTATESRATLVSSTNLPAAFLTAGPIAPRLNGGNRYVIPNPDYLRTDEGQDALRLIFNRPLGQPAFEANRRYGSTETTYASYGQATYKIQLGGDRLLDGVLGVRVTQTDRTISGATLATVTLPGGGTRSEFIPITADSSDVDVLPNATARLVLGGGIQARLGFSKAIRRPEFGQLNPSAALTIQNNPAVPNTGSSGDPDLRPQKSDSYDATLEYFGGSGFLSVAGFYRDITDRVIIGIQRQTIDGNTFEVSTPRNVGTAQLKGLEVSGQYFLDFLPGPLAGLGVQGAYTFVDSEIGGDDPLAGEFIQGVSKHNFTTGLLYDRYGISGRLIYTYRSRYYEDDLTGGIGVRERPSDRALEIYNPNYLAYVRPAGRLDFSVGYEINDILRMDIGGTNILRQQTRTYLQLPFVNRQLRGDETVYTLGVRARF